MRKLLLAIGAALAVAVTTVQANPLQEAFDAGITNGAVGGGFWRSTTGNFNIASYDLLFNLTPKANTFGAGLIVGGDYMWSGKSKGVFNDVKGGFSLNAKLQPLKSLGFTNFSVTISGGDAVASPRNSDVGVGNIAFGAADWSVNVYKRLAFHVVPAVQTRTGQGEFDRKYVGIQGFLSLGF